MISDELKEEIKTMISYYGTHQIDTIMKVRPGIIGDDFAILLNKLEKELE